MEIASIPAACRKLVPTQHISETKFKPQYWEKGLSVTNQHHRARYHVNKTLDVNELNERTNKRKRVEKLDHHLDGSESFPQQQGVSQFVQTSIELEIIALPSGLFFSGWQVDPSFA